MERGLPALVIALCAVLVPSVATADHITKRWDVSILRRVEADGPLGVGKIGYLNPVSGLLASGVEYTGFTKQLINKIENPNQEIDVADNFFSVRESFIVSGMPPRPNGKVNVQQRGRLIDFAFARKIFAQAGLWPLRFQRAFQRTVATEPGYTENQVQKLLASCNIVSPRSTPSLQRGPTRPRLSVPPKREDSGWASSWTVSGRSLRDRSDPPDDAACCAAASGYKTRKSVERFQPVALRKCQLVCRLRRLASPASA